MKNTTSDKFEGKKFNNNINGIAAEIGYYKFARIKYVVLFLHSFSTWVQNGRNFGIFSHRILDQAGKVTRNAIFAHKLCRLVGHQQFKAPSEK